MFLHFPGFLAQVKQVMIHEFILGMLDGPTHPKRGIFDANHNRCDVWHPGQAGSPD
jgi:hypothetical protein